MRIGVILLCAGKSSRLGEATAKPWLNLEGKAVMRHALESFTAHPKISGGVVVVAEDDKDEASKHSGDWQIAIGGEERSQSVRAGLEALAEQNPPEVVLIHDGARPFIPLKVLDDLIATLESGEQAVIPVLPVADSLKSVKNNKITERISRETIAQAQTPQGFNFTTILELHRQNTKPITDDSSLVEDSGHAVATISGDPLLAKITTKADLKLAKIIAQSLQETRSAIGFDIHRFNNTPGKIMLGGVAIKHSQSLVAHSDGDVLLHALTDAILSLCSDDDIGTLFPNTDEKYKDCDSAHFLKTACDKLKDAHGSISFVDITIIAEAPQIAKHRSAIKEKLASLLGISTKRIALKATTSEGIGFIGKGEGIAAQVLVTAAMPKGENHD